MPRWKSSLRKPYSLIPQVSCNTPNPAHPFKRLRLWQRLGEFFAHGWLFDFWWRWHRDVLYMYVWIQQLDKPSLQTLRERRESGLRSLKRRLGIRGSCRGIFPSWSPNVVVLPQHHEPSQRTSPKCQQTTKHTCNRHEKSSSLRRREISNSHAHKT
jgi:hypothetical protein